MEEKVLHHIKGYLYENRFTNNPNSYIARVSSERSLSINEICRSAENRGGADISAAAMQHAVELFFKEMGYQLCDGFSINTGWFNVKVQIKGGFENIKDSFDPKKHSVLFRFNQGELLRKELKNIDVNIQGLAKSGIKILNIIDSKSGSIDDIVTPGFNLKIKGSKLKLTGRNNNVGVYFVSEYDGSKIKVDKSDIVVNKPSELIVIIPDLPAGMYKIEITNQYSGSTILKVPRTCVFNKVLTVQ